MNWRWSIAMLSLLAGCDGSNPNLRVDAGPTDAAIVDAATADMPRTDAATDRGANDMRPADATAVDAIVDAAIDAHLDAAVDARMGDAFITDRGLMDARLRDAAVDAGIERDAVVDGAVDAALDAGVDAEPDQGMIVLCPDGTPMMPEACNGRDDDCDGTVDEGFGLAQRCEGVGRCGVGFVECDGNGGTRCSTSPGGSTAQDIPERCNGTDDDCDGTTDEGDFGAACYDGPEGTEGVGQCRAGRQRCVDGRLSECGDQVGPGPETCDGTDQDCDGQTDEDYVAEVACGQGVCQANAQPSRCADGVEVPCMPGQPMGDDANCDGLDDDCDGRIDEGYVVVEVCGAGRCAANARPSACVGGVERVCAPGFADPADVRCDGVDEDCDGSVDEDVPALTCGLGVCAANAIPSGCEDGQPTACVPGEPLDDDANCDGLDGDCDGMVDEGYVPQAECGVGVCGLAPTPSRCVEGEEIPCQPGEALGNDADCNGLDEDCDGQPDEGYQVVVNCGQGVCRDNATPSRCENGLQTACQPGEPAAGDDNCNGLDDDCNGVVDEDVVSLIGGEVRLTATQAGAIQPQIARAGDDALIVWSDNRDGGADLYTQRLNADGATVGDAVRLDVLGGNKFRPDIVSDGAGGYGVVWHNTRTGRAQVHFAKVDAAGAITRADLRVVNSNANAVGPQIAFDGRNFGVVWTDSRAERSQIWFQAISGAGELQGEARAVAEGDSPATVPALAAIGAGEGWVVVYNRDRAGDFDVFARRLSSDGVPQGEERQVSAGEGNANAPRVVRQGAGFMAVWYDTRHGNTEIYAARLGNDGARQGAEQRVSNDLRSSFLVDIAATDGGAGVAWTDRRAGNDEIWFRHLDGTAAPVGAAQRISNGAGASFSPALAWRAGVFEVVWYDARHGDEEEIYYARGPLGCPPE